jgi:transposase
MQLHFSMICSMASKIRSMHVARIIRTYKGTTYVSYLLRRSFREGTQVKHETLANLSHLPERLIDIIRRSLQGEDFAATSQCFRVLSSRPHGHVEAVLGTIRRLGLEALIAAKPSRPRNLVVAMIAERILFPCSKLATTRHWRSTTLAEELAVADAKAEELYAAMDWLLKRQAAIETKLAKEHLQERALVLYDVSSSYYEGKTCPLARYGHDRDGKKGLPIIVYGLLTDGAGRPVAVDVYPGNTGDPTTVPDQVDKLRQRFGLERVVLAGDRGMLTDTQIRHLREHPGLGWISALRSHSIRDLLNEGHLQRSLFDEMNLAEITAPEFPGERLIACYNPLLADQRRHKREALLVKTEEKLTALAAEVAHRTQKPLRQTEIALKAGRHINRWKMAKHFHLTIADGVFRWERDQASIGAEEQLDGIYVIRTSEPKRRLSAADSVRSYKRLGQVEQAFRSLKGIDLLIRPIYHRVPPRVRAHIFLCMLAYYVEWHMRRAWAPLLFADEDLEENRDTRDPVAPAEASESATTKKRTRCTADGLEVHSFRTLIAELAKRCRNTCQITSAEPESTFTQLTDLTPLQEQALRLLDLP